MTEPQKTLDALATWLRSRGAMMATAESCTGGLVAVMCTDRPGSSQWFERAFVTYSNSAKSELLGVPAALIERAGAVSEEVVCAMAAGAVLRSAADIAVAISGVAGPDGGSVGKPVGTVWLAYAVNNATSGGMLVEAECHLFDGDRVAVREAAATAALHGLWQLAKNTG